MAEESENGQEKTEDPTPKRQRDAKEKGQIPRSKELNTLAVMLVGAGALFALGDYMGNRVAAIMEDGLRLERGMVFNPNAPQEMLALLFGEGLLAVLPFALIMLVIALISPVALGGWIFSGKAIAPKLEKLNPLKGLKRIFGPQGLMELAKAIAKVAVVGVVGGLMLYAQREGFRDLAGLALGPALGKAADLFFGTFLILSASLILIALVDVPFQIWNHTQKIRMTHQEVRDEFKETEGKPEVKSRIRQLQQELAQGRMMENVPKADVVVTNPTHFAVALRYDQLKMKAPRVVAKGTDQVALRIRELAAEHNVPRFEAPMLARALYHTSELEREIPAGLYLAVAQVLAYIYQLRTATRGRRPAPPKPEIPEEFMAYARRGRPEAGR
ncbi:flagellar biosynthesis protein FlhB [Sediminicurvatus halobius]|uniref:Flagellar biosynthetic protein FlhB n=1 Tax=Sediminicurvatus halobius TaxID=2182432 RepID=A0A2U2N3J3_9GAMM|nr:flagellar biosynthesis protein FlhB [Spiribacter halobius]PWG63660.1 flagellar biosynthesis protein FlhB [Spiribacter halobius]UEX79798.1 flagellar biosynthesis protein FlhB [Spiribacter halobius]